jgi:hypothetical protein
MTPRAGHTLLELVLALLFLGLLGPVLVRATLAMTRSVRSGVAASATHQALESGAAFLASELGDAGRDSLASDLLVLGSDSVTYRAIRGAGLACALSPGDVWLRQDGASFPRLPQPGRDSLLVFLGTASPAEWVTIPVLTVGTSVCGAQPALRLGTRFDTTQVVLAAAPALAPALVFEVMQARLYSSSGAWWLGARSVSAGEIIQPLAGPLDPGGLSLAWRDSLGALTSQPSQARTVTLGLAGTWAGWPSAGTRAESAAVFLAPRGMVP